MKSGIVETFGAVSQIVAFSPVTGDDVPLAKQATSYSEYVVHRQNKGLEIFQDVVHDGLTNRSEEHTSELQSLMRISYAVFRLKKKITHTNVTHFMHDLEYIDHVTLWSNYSTKEQVAE